VITARINRPYFERLTQETLHRPDIRDLKAHYSHSPSSGFWILEYGVRFIGIIGVDASLDSTSDEPTTLKDKKKNIPAKKSSPTATIRHFFVEEEYRSADIQTDLLSYAVLHAFRSDDTVQRIKASDSPLAPYARETLRSSGFQLEEHTDKVGIFGWKLGIRILERVEWEKRQTKTQ
jgi:GNAT superfamily N-acetyltransferase